MSLDPTCLILGWRGNGTVNEWLPRACSTRHDVAVFSSILSVSEKVSATEKVDT